jgi:hypothetical protein
MQFTDISSNADFAAVSEPLKNLGLEIAQNRQRLETIHGELLALRTHSEGTSAWSNYINTAPDQSMRRQDLRTEAEALERRQQQLESALTEGRQQVEITRGRLSREPCSRARPLVIAEVRKILAALDQIDRANAAIAAIGSSLESAGFKVTGLPPAACDLHGLDHSYAVYIRHHYGELLK